MISCKVKPFTLKPSTFYIKTTETFTTLYSEKITLVIKLRDSYSVICSTHKTQKSRNTLREKCPHPELCQSVFSHI